jgi:hypothetical protein
MVLGTDAVAAADAFEAAHAMLGEVTDDGSDDDGGMDGEPRAGSKKSADSKMCSVPVSIKNMMLPMLYELMTQPQIHNLVLVHCPDFLASALFKVEYQPVVSSTPGLFSYVGNDDNDDDS